MVALPTGQGQPRDRLTTVRRLVGAGHQHGSFFKQGRKRVCVTEQHGIFKQHLKLFRRWCVARGRVRIVSHRTNHRLRGRSFPYQKGGIAAEGEWVYPRPMSETAKQRARDKIAWLAGQGLDLVTFWHDSSAEVARAVPHYMSPCWFTLDPASLLITSHYSPVMPPLPDEWMAHEYFEDDFHRISDVARSQRGISTIHEATDGDPSRSVGWNLYVRPYGADQEMMLALRTQAGLVWGMLGLYREPGEPMFDSDERRFLSVVAPHLA